MKEYFLSCMNCNKKFEVSAHEFSRKQYDYRKTGKRFFCSDDCRFAARGHKKVLPVTCTNCGKEFIPSGNLHKRAKSSNRFCSNSCAATYNNTHKKFGTRRSKLEAWIEEKLRNLYPDLEILFNDKSAINSELDIYIPSLKLAFELNGIFHYEPIFGEDKFDKIKENDNNKFQLCQQNGISLCIIDTSSQKYVTESSSQKFLDIILKIIEEKDEKVLP